MSKFVKQPYNRGAANPRAKLTEDDIRKIRELHRSTRMSLAEIGERFGIGGQSVSDICSGRRWKHVIT